MLGHLTNREEVGYFSAAWNIAYILPLIIVSVCTALFPKVSRMLSKDELRTYVNKLLSFSPLIIPIMIGAIFLSRWAILLIYGGKYLLCVGPLQILVIGYSLILLIVPISLVLYSLDKAWAIAIVNFLELASHGMANYFLIPSHGASGAAFSNLVVKIITTAVTLGFVYFFLKKTDEVVETKKLYREVVKV
jgi:O-antigen/teichoic acid export membrane protein